MLTLAISAIVASSDLRSIFCSAIVSDFEMLGESDYGVFIMIGKKV